jgi:amino acid adenylation domain-containing protein
VQLETFLEQSAQQRPEKTALVCGGCRYSYAVIEVAASRLARALVAEGIQPGDRVAIWLDNCAEAVLSIFATWKAGAVVLPIGPTAKPEKLVGLLNNSRAAGLILRGRLLAALETVQHQLPHLRSLIAVGEPCPAGKWPGKGCYEFSQLVENFREQTSPPAKRAIDLDLAALIYTSGSTGSPKGVMHTHLSMVSAAASISTYLKNTDGDVILSVLPLSFGYGLYQVLTAFRCGATVVLEKSFAYPHAMLETLSTEQATGFPMVPTISAILLRMDLKKYDLSALRYLTNAGDAWPVEHIRQLRQSLPHVQLFSMYGQTECIRASYLAPEEIDRRPRSVGLGTPNAEVYVVDDQGRRVGPGVVGELVVRGSHVMQGYWELPEETDRRLQAGPLAGQRVLHTGDLFYTDENGYLYFYSRTDDVIKTRGEKVSPKEVENAMYAHPDVAEAAVVGVADHVLGQAVKAFVVRKPGCDLTERQLLRHCAGLLEDFMVPKSVEFRDTLPKNSHGKIDRRELCGANHDEQRTVCVT